MSETQNIQWFPGHMQKTRKKIKQSLTLVDAVAEIVDARIPVSSRNPDLAGIIENKPRLIILNKSDMADKAATEEWIREYKRQGIIAVPFDAKNSRGMNEFIKAVKTLLAKKLETYAEKGMVGRTLKVMVVGIPNVGKSSFINRMAKQNKAKVENRPGVTRDNQWVKIDNNIELLDTAGVLWPKFEDKTVAERLAFTGAVKDQILDIEKLAFQLVEYLKNHYPERLVERYKIDVSGDDIYELMLRIGKKRGMLISGGEIDTERTANMLIDEYRSGKLGLITIEHASDGGNLDA